MDNRMRNGADAAGVDTTPPGREYPQYPAGAIVAALRTALLRRGRLALGVTILGTVLTGIALLAAPRSYTASVQIALQSATGDSRNQYLDESVIESHLAMLGADTHIGAVRADLAAKSLVANSPAAQRLPSVAELKARVRIAQERRSRIIRVSYSSARPDEAASVANRFAAVHLETLEARLRADAASTLEHVERQIKDASSRVAKADAAVQTFRLIHGLGELAQVDIRLISDLRAHLTQAQMEKTTWRTALSEARGGSNSGTTAVSTDPAASPKTAMFSSSPDVAGAERNLQAAESKERQLEQQIAELQRNVADRLDEIAQLRVLERKSMVAGKLLEDLLARHSETQERLLMPRLEARILAPAAAPLQASSISPLFLMALATFSFAFLGGALAVLLDRLDPSIRDERRAEEALGIPCLGQLPEPEPAMEPEPVHVAAPMWSGAQVVRAMAAELLDAERVSPAPILLVTSSLLEEGAADLAEGLAACIAGLDLRVCLLDLGCLAENAGARQRLFAYVPGGEVGLEPTHITRARLVAALRPLRHSYDCVVVLGPPVLSSVEVGLIASFCDRVILAVRWGHTAANIARYATRLLAARSPDGAGVLDRAVSVLTAAREPASPEMESVLGRSSGRPLESHGTPPGWIGVGSVDSASLAEAKLAERARANVVVTG